MRKDPRGYLTHDMTQHLREYHRYDSTGAAMSYLSFGDSITFSFRGSSKEIDKIEAAFKAIGYTQAPK